MSTIWQVIDKVKVNPKEEDLIHWIDRNRFKQRQKKRIQIPILPWLVYTSWSLAVVMGIAQLVDLLFYIVYIPETSSPIWGEYPHLFPDIKW